MKKHEKGTLLIRYLDSAIESLYPHHIPSKSLWNLLIFIEIISPFSPDSAGLVALVALQEKERGDEAKANA